jgi:CRISPR system Cascade subunit CasB
MSDGIETVENESKEQRFVNYLEQLDLNGDRAALAALRRSLGQPIGHNGETHRYILWINPSTWDEPYYYLIAGLYALHPTSWHRTEANNRLTNFGASMARLNREVVSSSIERRFVALLDAHEDDLAEHLRQTVSLLKSRDVPVDWVRLLKDLRSWKLESKSVQRQWARAFWVNDSSTAD